MIHSGIFLSVSRQLDHPAVHCRRRGICVRPTRGLPSPAACHGATGSARHGEQRGYAVLLHSSFPGRQSVGEPAEAPVLLSAAGRKSESSVLQHRAALQRILLCKGRPLSFVCLVLAVSGFVIRSYRQYLKRWYTVNDKSNRTQKFPNPF